MVDTTLRTINNWYTEPANGGERPKLLSKMAIIELCGWLEGEFDRLALLVEQGRLNDATWVRENLISKTHGFNYTEHWRAMLQKMVGELFARKIESHFDAKSPGDLDQLKSLLGNLWRIRCSFTHADMQANIASQQTFSAPSWTINQHRILRRLLTSYEDSITTILAPL